MLLEEIKLFFLGCEYINDRIVIPAPIGTNFQVVEPLRSFVLSAMASVLKAQKANASKFELKGKGKRKADDMDVEEAQTEIALPKKKKNKQRVLLLSSRGITHRMRHFMNDLEALLPHVKKGKLFFRQIGYENSLVRSDSKLDSKSQLHLLPELADLNNCNNTLYFEARRHEDLYMWAAKMPNGPSIKMHVQNVHTMDELKMTGNCLKGSRGILSFDKGFDETEWGKLTKEVFTHVSILSQEKEKTNGPPDIRCPSDGAESEAFR